MTEQPTTSTSGFDPVASVQAATEQVSRLRDRIARLTPGGRSGYPELDPLLRTLRQYHPRNDTRIIEQAYETAALLHRNQKRRSGEPYITHPLAVATILAELGMTSSTLVAALLHDTVEDTGYSLEALTEDFGDEIAALVDGVTKLDKVQYGSSSGAETVRKMVVAMAQDIRVIVIKLADRLHNMRTINWLSPAKQKQKSTETLEIFAPLAHRLGMNTIKWELEDLAFATLQPKVYEEIVNLVAKHAPERDQQLNNVITALDDDMRTSRIKTEVTGRPKNYYSIYQKMVVRGRDFKEIYDLVGVRILVETVRDCYAVLGVIHSRWSPVPGRFKDFIAMPKYNMYQSLHTTVIGPAGKPVELQIRTYQMHRAAEFGVAAHWRYKNGAVPNKSGPDDLAWMRQLLDWQRETEDPEEFLDSLRYDLSSNEVFVFTPNGDIMSLPTGATPIDFAYAVHTEVGHRCVGARVNGRLVALESELGNGDNVEIFTNKDESSGPSRDWLQFVKSPRARSKIKAWFSRERREEAEERGKGALTRILRKRNLPIADLLNQEVLTELAHDLRLNDVSALYAEIGENRMSAESVVKRLLEQAGGVDEVETVPGPDRVARKQTAGSPGVVVAGDPDVWIKLARCCTPVPGDAILGFVTRGHGVSVHRESCTNVSSLKEQENRMVEVDWEPTETSVFLVNIQVEALDRAGLLSDVTSALSEQHVNILSASVSTNKERLALSNFSFEMAEPHHLGAVLRSVRRVEGVYDAYRV
ncbi:MAG: bifunctional (p)ppGpp synthetase/guanosine-3',5'-bis(diphosphate) 3'-pyrophosphohydrolase [Actinomycetia bacterium]|nr:bifunctional (p)ppGpp synthetase/guanosine-3',5'-bis(diphosphate) 3'-pyrophosphohydrolase [Actinomycetes bacterium]MCH9800139.1 bifunctional (p)ppGpp synthetase/guanosine-3',5'-bis(diphosphate) 3'-pyrophosphohydrolase [Actinomycetes bacterium]